jgi:stage II sporulation protein E
VALYATLVRGVGFRLTWDERVCLSALLGALTYGVFSCKVGQFSPYDLLLPFLTIFLAYGARGEGVLFALAIGLGTGDAAGVCTAISCYVAVMIFKNHSRYLAAGACVLAYATAGGLLGTLSVLGLGTVSVGALIFVLIPKRKMARALAALGMMGEDRALRGLVNRNRADVKERIRQIAGAFYAAHTISVYTAEEESEVDVTERLCAELEARFCKGCPSKKGCNKLLGGSAKDALMPMVSAAVKNGRATVLDLPAFLTGNCMRVDKLVDLTGEIVREHKGAISIKRTQAATQRVVSSVMDGVGKMLDEIADSLGISLGFDPSVETRIADELNYLGVPAQSVAVYGDGDNERVSLVLRERDADRHAVVKAAQKITGRPMRVVDVRDGEIGRKEVWLAPTPKYEVIVGRACTAHGDEPSGDTFTATRLPDGRCLFAIVDGMGTGRRADEESVGLVAMVESFLRAGFSGDVVLPVVNKMMLLGNGERFQTLDLVVLDTASGTADFAKLGACQSVVRSGDKIRVIEGSALPVGVLEDAMPCIRQEKLVEGETVVMFSDGLIDTIGATAVYEKILSLGPINPQTVCDELVARAKAQGAKDDVSVVAFRIFATY